ncbi:AAEL011337-PA [Aedes aegypti]|uniref:AAEL011337-PA n=1 Tax=Aedes aegypti TaxID=7159 RepID=Q16QC1_AEDAE|nr:AAEL011337-PA [Aedes aegypti]
MRSLVFALLVAVLQVGSIARADNPCQGILSGILVSPEVCYEFIVCYLEEAEIVTCPEGTIFSKELVTCVPGNQQTCKEGLPEEPEEGNPCRGVVLSRFPHPESCTKFYSCLLGRLREHTCRDGFVFSQRFFICLPGNPDSCNVQILPTTTTPAPGSIKPVPADYCLINSQPFGRLPHPQLCTKFVSCQLWIPTVQECPSWTVYSERLRICIPGNPNTCATLIDPEGPTTTTLAPITNEICEGKLVGILPHPHYCYMYISCLLGVATERECPRLHVFSEQNSMCRLGNRETCTVLGQS